MKFKDLKWDGNAVEGIQAVVKFENGFSVSIVRNKISYGNEKGFYEIGVFNSDHEMIDPLDWGDTVKGWLLPSDVMEQLELIKTL